MMGFFRETPHALGVSDNGPKDGTLGFFGGVTSPNIMRRFNYAFGVVDASYLRI